MTATRCRSRVCAGAYTGAGVADLQAIERTLGGAAVTIDSASGDAYRLTVASATGNAFTVERRSDGTVELTCTRRGWAGCPAGGTWG